MLQARAAGTQIQRPDVELVVHSARDSGREIDPGIPPHAVPGALMKLQGNVAQGAERKEVARPVRAARADAFGLHWSILGR
jgi:hypothetical protein